MALLSRARGDQGVLGPDQGVPRLGQLHLAAQYVVARATPFHAGLTSARTASARRTVWTAIRRNASASRTLQVGGGHVVRHGFFDPHGLELGDLLAHLGLAVAAGGAAEVVQSPLDLQLALLDGVGAEAVTLTTPSAPASRAGWSCRWRRRG